MTVIINGDTGIDTVQDGIVTDSKLTLTANSQEIKDAINATGSAPIYACRAWVNFNGTGTVAIRASGNVSSITDNGTGNYIVNFTTAMPDANYSTVGLSRRGDTDNNSQVYLPLSGTYSTTACQVFTGATATAGTGIDSSTVCISVFR